ncbi:leucyl aminopeptidase family protein [Klebsiella sp. BIGb0407]|uniref:M17 family metallopeptidase n=1 Tax=Klebsiella sp. BIGb0407 TaxID=2940603 RepID=UPI002168D5F7|nr:leucyl aminopeptidase family protein [Klebsiella sp. BIGb0407]MCS3432819.1 leucyl aminopeptidase [Klebsiella sp. BIGb0407]
MINSQVTSNPLTDGIDSYLISFANSQLLVEAAVNPELLSGLRKDAATSVADCAYGCDPFARITLLPDNHWLDSVTCQLQAALRPLLRKTHCPALIVDCSLWDTDNIAHRAQLSALLIFLLNLDYQLSDLGLKTTASQAVRINQLTLWCQPQQQAGLEKLLRQAEATARGMIAARRIADFPSSSCTPEFVVSEIEKQITAYPALKCEVLDENQIKQQGLGLLDAVGKGASNPPRLLILRYEGQSQGPFKAYVGKGITFDTGGMWLKEGAGMYTMKYDMCGAANVFGLLIAAAELKLPVRLVGVLALAENMIGPDVMRPGDVAMSHSGLSVEINNTDAEGRLVLADAISWASQLTLDNQKPQYIIDMATLTGAVVKALGYDLTGLWSQDAKLSQQLTQAGLESRDEVWSLPLDARFAPQVESAIADLCNTPTNNAAISTSAAYFLRCFCPDDIPWAHLDISGTALWREQGRSVSSGRPIPLLMQHLLNDLEK